MQIWKVTKLGQIWMMGGKQAFYYDLASEITNLMVSFWPGCSFETCKEIYPLPLLPNWTIYPPPHLPDILISPNSYALNVKQQTMNKADGEKKKLSTAITNSESKMPDGRMTRRFTFIAVTDHRWVSSVCWLMGGGGGGGLGRAGRMLLCRPSVLVPLGKTFPWPAVSEVPIPTCKLSWEALPGLGPALVLMCIAPVDADRWWPPEDCWSLDCKVGGALGRSGGGALGLSGGGPWGLSWADGRRSWGECCLTPPSPWCVPPAGGDSGELSGTLRGQVCEVCAPLPVPLDTLAVTATE